jgi:alpha-glucosidase
MKSQTKLQEDRKIAKLLDDYYRVKYNNSKLELLSNIVEVVTSKNEVSLKCSNGELIVSVVNDSIIRVRTILAGKVILPSFSIESFEYKDVDCSISEDEFNVFIKTEKLLVEISKESINIIIKNIDDEIISSDDKPISFNNEFIKCEKVLSEDEKFYGFGEKAGNLQKRGSSMSMWNTDYPGYEKGTDPLYKSVPFFIGLKNKKAYGIFVDSPAWSYFDMGKSNKNTYSYSTYKLNLDYYFIYGPEIREVVDGYTYLTGRMEMPPLWALGYQQCRWSYYPESRVKNLADDFRDKKIPCDVIYLDIDYMDAYKIFTVDKTRFPDMKYMTDCLSEQGFKVVTIIDVGVKVDDTYDVYKEGVENNYFVKKPSGKLFIAKIWPGDSVFPDYFDVRVAGWWSSLNKKMIDKGIAGIWNDVNEPATFETRGKTMSLDVLHNINGMNIEHALVHNAYGLMENKATFKGLKEYDPKGRVFILSRSAFSGGQKYFSVWLGDNQSNEEHLKLNISQCLNIGLSGYAFAGVDIGGFGGNPSPELYTRWLQYGVFLPLCRTHSAKDTEDQEPWSFGEKYEEINRKSIELRYKLLPYLYSLFYEAHCSGTPIIRPLVFEYQDDENVYECEDQFMFGSNILIAPILEEYADTKKVYLPKGEWYDFHNDDKYDGESSFEVKAAIDKIPIFIKAGSIIPEQKVIQYVGERPIDEIILNVYPGECIDNFLYEDDGNSDDYLKGDFRITNFVQSIKENKMFLNISKSRGEYKVNRNILIKIHAIQKPFASLFCNTDEFPITDSFDSFNSTFDIAYYNEESKILYIKIKDESKEIMFTLIY